jgi:hypothetical protein
VKSGAWAERAHKVGRALASERMPQWAAAIGAALALPSLAAGFALDDYVHHAKAVGDLAGGLTPSAGSTDLFRFWDGDPQWTRDMVERGVTPWFTFDGIKCSFWRPLASLSHALDYRLWPDQPALMHAESVALYALCVFCVGLLARAWIADAVVAGLVALMYAVDGGHAPAVGWLATRNAVLAALFGYAALLAHHAWRAGGKGARAGALLGPIAYACALFSAEAGVGAAAYVVAYAACLERGPWTGRALGVVPYALVTALWRALYVAMGYGVAGTDLYVDPSRETAHFLALFPARFIEMALAVVTELRPADAWRYVPHEYAVLAVVGAVAFALAAWLLAPLLAKDREARFAALGAAFAIVPTCTTFPQDRNLFFAGLGGSILVAKLAVGALRGDAWVPDRPRFRRAARVVGAVWLVNALVAGALVFPVGVLVPRLANLLMRFDRGNLFEGEDLRGRTLVLLSARDALSPIYEWLIPPGVDRFGKLRLLAVGPTQILVTRTGERTMRVRAPAGNLLTDAFVSFWRASDRPLPSGYTRRFDDVTVAMTERDAEGAPVEIECRFDLPLDDPGLVFLAWTGIHFVPFAPPRVGATVSAGGT